MWQRSALWVLIVAVGCCGARELDPGACATRFDVQRDKIIRTEESREMGALYLSELDVGARDECRRLCCETDSCDVFVYEEKGPGSCYLFKCGPPEDFRCKFTAHSNFSSGVLALSRHLAELQDQEHRTRTLGTATGTTTVPTTSATPATPSSALPAPPQRPPQPLSPQEPPRRCSRYQFECRRGGECIAVYNACDGVPQCADGSDEAPELGCPALAPAPPAASHSLQPPASAVIATIPTTLFKSLQESVVLSPHEPILPAGGSSEAEARWPHRLAQAQTPVHRYPEGSHIFSHKGGLLQEPGGAQFPFEPPAPWPHRPWPQSQQTGPEGGTMVGRGWDSPAMASAVAGPDGTNAGMSYWAEPDPRRAWPVPQQRTEPEGVAAKTMPEIPMPYGGRQQALRDQPKKGFELEVAPPGTGPEPPTLPQTLPAHPVPATAETIHDTEKVQAVQGVQGVQVAQFDEPPEGLSERPPAAVLLLVLGVLMTSVLGALVGCRARAARRRIRRGKSPFAHDADYLVNGMYL